MNVTHCGFYLLAFYAYTTQHKQSKMVSGTVSSDFNVTASKLTSSNGLKHWSTYSNLNDLANEPRNRSTSPKCSTYCQKSCQGSVVSSQQRESMHQGTWPQMCVHNPWTVPITASQAQFYTLSQCVVRKWLHMDSTNDYMKKLRFFACQ